MLLLDSRVLADQQLNKHTQQRFASPAIEPLALTRVKVVVILNSFPIVGCFRAVYGSAELKLRDHLIRMISCV